MKGISQVVMSGYHRVWSGHWGKKEIRTDRKNRVIRYWAGTNTLWVKDKERGKLQ